MKIFLLIPLLLCISACSFLTKDLTPEQRYFASKQDLESVLTAVVQYKNICYERVKSDPCYSHVIKLQEFKPRIEQTFDLAESYRTQGNTPMITAVTSTIIWITSELSAYLIKLNQEKTNGFKNTSINPKHFTNYCGRIPYVSGTVREISGTSV
jgi:hypothetical protein